MACRRVASRPRAAPGCPSPPSRWPSVLCALALAATASQRCRSPATHASPVRASQLFGRPSPENARAAASADTFFCFKASSSTTLRRPRARRRRALVLTPFLIETLRRRKMGFPEMEKAEVITKPHSVDIVSLHDGGLEEGIAKLIKKGGEVLQRIRVIDRSCFRRNFFNVDNVMASLAANLDALIAVDGITHAKMRHTVNRTAQQIDYLSLVVAIVTALHGSCHEVRALGYSVEGHVLEAAKRVVARPLPPLNEGTVAVEAYTSKGVRMEPIPKALREWIQAPKRGMLAKPEYDADAVFFAIAFLAPDKEVDAVSLDRDLLTVCSDLVTPGKDEDCKDKQVLNQFRNPFFASEPAASIHLLFQICCGSDFCKHLANCRRGCTGDKFVEVTRRSARSLHGALHQAEGDGALAPGPAAGEARDSEGCETDGRRDSQTLCRRAVVFSRRQGSENWRVRLRRGKKPIGS